MALPVAGGRGCCTQAELLEVVGPEKEQALPLPPATLRGGAGAADFFIRDRSGLCGTAASLIAAGVAVDVEDAAAMLGRYKAPSRLKQQLLPRQEQQPPPTQRGTADGSVGAIASQGSRRS